MDHALCIDVVECSADCDSYRATIGNRKNANPPGDFTRVESVDKLSYQNRHAIDFASVERRDYIRMREAPDHSHFGIEALECPGLSEPVTRQHFHGDLSPELGVPRQIDAAHPASADSPDDFIFTNLVRYKLGT